MFAVDRRTDYFYSAIYLWILDHGYLADFFS